MRFFDHFLKGTQSGWDKQPRVQLNVRRPGEKFEIRHEDEWPLARTQWTRFFLDPDGMRLAREAPRAAKPLTYDPMGDGLTFSMVAEQETEITGPSALKVWA